MAEDTAQVCNEQCDETRSLASARFGRAKASGSRIQAIGARSLALTAALGSLVGCSADKGASSPGNTLRSGNANSSTQGTGSSASTVSTFDGGPPPADRCLQSGTCPAGVWIDVTPAGISLDPSAYSGDNFGVQDVLTDPTHANIFYAFTCHQGVWKSTDYGQNWTGPINDGSLPNGKQWSSAVSINPSNPSGPPVLWTFSWPTLNIYRSMDGGLTWLKILLPATILNTNGSAGDGYSVDVDPYDPNHLIVGFHEAYGVAETTNGLAASPTFTDTQAPSSVGQSVYVFFINTGDATTTRKTWLAIPQQNGGAWGTWRTTDEGKTWTQPKDAVTNAPETNEHLHGACQILQQGGLVFMAGVYGTSSSTSAVNGGAYRSTDLGATWTHVGNAFGATVAYGTSNNVYSQWGMSANAGDNSSTAQSAPMPGVAWSAMAVPSAMLSGPKRVAVSNDGQHNIMVSGSWNSGIWRYIEPSAGASAGAMDAGGD
jgi:hypothetical protein